MKLGMGKLGISRTEFWQMTYAELLAIHEGRFGKPEPQMTLEDFRDLKERFRKV